MKKFSWAVAGVLVALTALPTLASAAGDSSADSLRTRRTDLLRRVEPTMPAPVAPGSEQVVIGETSRSPERNLPPRFEPNPGLPGFSEAYDALDLDVQLELGPLMDMADFSMLERPLSTPTLPSELQAVIRRELASLHCLDLPVEH